MMAGTGVSVGGAGMLRARRRDVSVKPNRKLDRKSSRGMIYENEELRLRTIHINAEVEQGQNDIKKLRRENEQLRREIWSLRDEYDKLEEILKRQKSSGDSEEYEDRSEEDEDVQSDYSCEEDEDAEPGAKEAGDEAPEDCNTKEQLENVENDKISSEKMSNSLHRLHVDFDDLSVVDEEEELKKDREKKDGTSGDARKPPALRARQLHENIPFYPAAYAVQNTFNNPSYYSGCPLEFPSTMSLMVPDASLIAPPRPPVDPVGSSPGLELPDAALPQIHVPPAGWRANLVLPDEQAGYPTASVASGLTPAGPEIFSTEFPDPRFTSASRKPGHRKQSLNSNEQASYEDLRVRYPEVRENGWVRNARADLKIADYEDRSKKPESTEGMFTFEGSEKPKHFFAPLPSKLRKQPDEGSPTSTPSQFGTGTSSSSGRTGSTVISKGPFTTQKGGADIYVNGAVPCESRDEKAFLSTDNLLIGEGRSPSSQLIKSISCQELTESQTTPASLRTQFTEGRPQMFTQSDNTLDSTANESAKPYKSHLNVTLRPPRPNQPANLDYRQFNNPFLETFDPTRQFTEQGSPVTRPLSIQVTEDNPYYHYASPVSTFARANTVDRRNTRGQDRNRLLIPSTQLFPSKTLSTKHDVEITSFERPSPHTLVSPAIGYDLTKLRRVSPAGPYLQTNLYQNVPFVPEGGAPFYPGQGPLRLYYENLAPKVSAQTQTSIDGDSHREMERVASQVEEEGASAPSSPSQRRRKPLRKDGKEQSAISPGAQRRLKKQSSVTSSETMDSSRAARKKPRKPSITAASETHEEKNESRSSSSGQDSPRKEQSRRVSLYFSAKKRPSITSVRTTRSASVDTTKDKYMEGLGSERERTNSISSRETASVKARKASTSSGNVPWCACWGNGCI